MSIVNFIKINFKVLLLLALHVVLMVVCLAVLVACLLGLFLATELLVGIARDGHPYAASLGAVIPFIGLFFALKWRTEVNHES